MSADSTSGSITHRVNYHGRVQGVGFRHTVNKLAQRRPVTGYVKNLPDGTVELVVTSTLRDFEEFQQAIQSAFEGYITSFDVDTLTEDPRFQRFEVRRG